MENKKFQSKISLLRVQFLFIFCFKKRAKTTRFAYIYIFVEEKTFLQLTLEALVKKKKQRMEYIWLLSSAYSRGMNKWRLHHGLSSNVTMFVNLLLIRPIPLWLCAIQRREKDIDGAQV